MSNYLDHYYQLLCLNMSNFSAGSHRHFKEYLALAFVLYGKFNIFENLTASNWLHSTNYCMKEIL